MLYVYLGTHADSIHYVSDYFNAMYEPEWLNNDFARRAIHEVDKSEYVNGDYIKDYQGIGMSARGLSTGCKALILLYNEPEHEICGERLGDNCFPLLFFLAEKKDIHITLSHLPILQEPFRMMITNSNKLVTTMKEFATEMISCSTKGLIKYAEHIN